MKCPKCRSEVINQPVCPYCGATVYVGDTTRSVPEYTRRAGGASQPVGNRQMRDIREMERKFRNLETKVNLILVLEGGSFLLVVLALIVLALK